MFHLGNEKIYFVKGDSMMWGGKKWINNMKWIEGYVMGKCHNANWYYTKKIQGEMTLAIMENHRLYFLYKMCYKFAF